MPQCLRYISLLFCCCLLLTACSTDDGTTTGTTTADDTNRPVVFSAGMAKAGKAATRTATRAANEINENGTGGDTPEALKTIYEGRGFGVFGCYTGLHGYSESSVNPDFMYNQQVQYNGALPHPWYYTPLKYWPNGEGQTNSSLNTGENPHYVSFMAYAPWSDDTNVNPDSDTQPVDYCIASFSKQGELGNPWLVYRLNPKREKQVDLLCASPMLDQEKPAVNAYVHFQFRHALACVGDTVRILCSDGLQGQIEGRVNAAVKAARVVVTSLTIEYTLTAKARLVLWFAENNEHTAPMNWQTILSEAPQTQRTVTVLTADDPRAIHTYETAATDNPYQKTGLGVYYIPAELEGYRQTAKVSITYHIETSATGSDPWKKEEDIVGTATLAMKDYADAYQSGKHLNINITLSPMDIALTAAIAPWIEEEPVEIEGIEE